MIVQNPIDEFRRECQAALSYALKQILPDAKIDSFALNKPPNPEFGNLASSLCFELGKKLGQKPMVLAERFVKALGRYEFNLVEKVSSDGGYVNFYVNFPKFSMMTINSVRQLGSDYGFVKANKPAKVIVEHTSVNPLHPIHIGQARNPMLGDALARILKGRGHTVATHYYIDDVGRQSSVLAYAYSLLGEPKPQGKSDLFVGKIYTVTSCLVELNRLRRGLDSAKATSNAEEISRLNGEISEWVSIAAELETKFPDLFAALLDKVGKTENPEEEINKLNRAYEDGEPKAKRLIRAVSDLCLSGFRETMLRLGVSYDSWDWESDFVWSGQVTEALRRLKKSGFASNSEGVLEFDAEKTVRTLGLKPKLGMREDYEVPPLTLVRADGTTLYTTRDVAYTLWKFGRADRVVNVIGMEQSLAQLQLKIALFALRCDREAN